jgi:formate C-acetyltransferase
MLYNKLREELKAYYWQNANNTAKVFYEKNMSKLNYEYEVTYAQNMSPMQMKALQYKVISDSFEPILFLNSPFYYETGLLSAHCDGAMDFRGHQHAGGWTYWKNEWKFKAQNPNLWNLVSKQKQELFYLICGPYNDVKQHYVFNYRPVFQMGLKGIYNHAIENLKTTTQTEEIEFLESVCTGLKCLKSMGEKFAQKAKEILVVTEDESVRANLKRISETACRVPWEAPKTFYEALNTYAFLRTTVGSLEGIGLNSFGRVDIDLYPYYQNDLRSGTLTENEAYELICKFLITWDLHYDHDMKFVLYSDHELENTYVLGGCDENGKAVYNELTKMFLKATREEKIIFPKIKCRYSKDSPKEYLDEINKSIIKGTSSVLFQNDDAIIPALVRAGRTLLEARDYIVSGCWGLTCQEVEKFDSGSYVNLLKPFEYAIHHLSDKMEMVGMRFESFDDAKSFEEVYQILLKNIGILLNERARVTREGGRIVYQVAPLPIFSSTLKNCLDNRRDYTKQGAKYNDDHYMMFGFPNIIDSLMAIKELCFERKKYTLKEFLSAVRVNWENNEEMRLDAVHCCGWGDASEAACSLANRFNKDLYDIAQTLEGTYGGKVQIAYLTYTEVRWWGEKTLATPDGRRNGEYFAQGLTPSRLKKIASVTDVINSLQKIDGSLIAGNSVVNIILPSGKTTLDVCEAFLRSCTNSAMQCLQLNCTSKKELLDAQKHPEKYPDLIVRVTGFSARFTALSPEWQQEVLTRNFYE